jgi:CspA family cold shock protein
MEGYKTLKKGQLVEFESTQGPKGLHATSIRLTVDPNASV